MGKNYIDGAMMSQKDKIIDILKVNNLLTQSAIAEAIYGDNNHSTAIYSALTKLVKQGIISRRGNRPAYYELKHVYLNDQTEKSNSNHSIPSLEENDFKISNDIIEKTARMVQSTSNYGVENSLISRCLKKFPLNTDPELVAMKVGLIDITNSTHLSQYKSKISIFEIVETIVSIPNIDERIEQGDPEVVNEIARTNGKINLFSFASKYCCYHNRNLYGKDDYSIIDTVLKNSLPLYFDDITKGKIQKWQDNLQYKEYNDYITNKLDELGITIEHRKRKFDHFVWYRNR